MIKQMFPLDIESSVVLTLQEMIGPMIICSEEKLELGSTISVEGYRFTVLRETNIAEWKYAHKRNMESVPPYNNFYEIMTD